MEREFDPGLIPFEPGWLRVGTRDETETIREAHFVGDKRVRAAMSDAYKKLVRVAVRAFYDGEVPPRPAGEAQAKTSKVRTDATESKAKEQTKWKTC